MRKRKIFSAFFAAVISIGMMLLPCTASAVEDSGTQDGLVASICSEKYEYSADEDIELTFKVTNTNDFAVENVSLEAIIPDGLTIKDEADTSVNTVSLASDESLELSLVVAKKSGGDIVPSSTTINTTETSTSATQETKNAAVEVTTTQSDNISETTAKVGQSAVSDSSNTNSGNGTDKSDNTSIKTGKSTLYLAIGLICLACIFAGIIAVRFRKSSKRYISLVLCLTIILGSVASVGIPIAYASETQTETIKVTKNIAVDNTKYDIKLNVTYNKKSSGDKNSVTRGEWVNMLVSEFSMSLDDTADYEAPYTDISDSKYNTSIVTAYYNAVLPTDIEEFNPNEYATRDFAAFTLNNCLCYVKNSDLSCDDFSEIKYQDAASALVERGYFALVGNKFMPNNAVTTGEMSNVSELIKKSLQALEIDPNHEQVVNINDDTVMIKENIVKSVDGDTVSMELTDETSALKEGSVFFVPNPDNSELYIAYKVDKITVTDGEVVVEVSDPEIDEMFNKLDIQGIATASAKNAVPLVDGAKVVKGDNSVGANLDNNDEAVGFGFSYSDEIDLDATKFYYKDTYSFKSDKGNEISVTLDGGLKNPVLKYAAYVDVNWGKVDYNFFVALNNELSFEGTAKIVAGKGESGKLDLATFSIPLCGGLLSVDVVVSLVASAEGELTLKCSLANEVGVRIDNNGVQFIKDFKKPNIEPEGKVTASVGLRPQVNLCITCKKVVGVYAEIGATAKAVIGILKDNLMHCDLSAWMYLNIGYDTGWFVKDICKEFDCDSGSINVLTESNSPLKVHSHIEEPLDDIGNINIVDKCTYRYVSGEIKINSVPLNDVNIIVKNGDKEIAVENNKTNDFGKFGFVIPADTAYPDKLTFIFSKDGYDSVEKTVTVKYGEDTDLGTIEMKKSSGEEETPTHPNDEWKQLYINYINEIDDRTNSSYDYSLIYLDSDDIPELCLTGNFFPAGDILCWINNDSVQKEPLGYYGGTSYIEKDGLLINTGGQQGIYYDNVFSFDGKILELRVDGDYYEVYDDEGNFTYEFAYYIDGYEVTRTEYVEKIYSAFNESKAIKVSDETYSKEEIIEIIKNI